MENNSTQNQIDDSLLKANLDALTKGIQKILDIGAEDLAEAEEKTEIASNMDPESKEYRDLVQEIKSAQARAAKVFSQAEDLIATANRVLQN